MDVLALRLHLAVGVTQCMSIQISSSNVPERGQQVQAVDHKYQRN